MSEEATGERRAILLLEHCPGRRAVGSGPDTTPVGHLPDAHGGRRPVHGDSSSGASRARLFYGFILSLPA